MSRRNRRNRNKLFTQSVSEPRSTNESSSVNNSSVEEINNSGDIKKVVLVGGFCVCLLLGLSYVINNTAWLNPVMDKFNNLM